MQLQHFLIRKKFNKNKNIKVIYNKIHKKRLAVE
jgi:hypothetical protein